MVGAKAARAVSLAMGHMALSRVALLALGNFPHHRGIDYTRLMAAPSIVSKRPLPLADIVYIFTIRTITTIRSSA